MRRHGWSGDLPGDDDEAVRRILAATRACIDRSGTDTSLAEVARRLGVTRQTIYRYFANTDELLVATAFDAVDPFLDRIERHLSRRGGTPAEVVVEGVAFTLEQLPSEPYVGLLLSAERGSAVAGGITSEHALALGRGFIERFPVDWPAAGFGPADLDELVEQMLRTMQSFVMDAGTPRRTGAGLRDYLMRWLAPCITVRADARRVPVPDG
ncbi:TetR family transcriptional regulator [Actinomadura craniellae]|uniref:TetR family transcriptional regulator n=1 Tax=Actinomadura craniellae TaxID=2231787 RepID=A0A365H0R6_9ACTN|nr:TetR family transcriptional regulator [Actinomadura craniellae]